MSKILFFDSFPWNKKYFKAAMKQTIDYTTKLCNYEVNVPLEQQICLMKASENIKQKAMLKLREVKSKADETGSKARQWLEGLLKIPFGVLKEEPMLKKYNEIKEEYQELTETELDENINLLKIKNNVEIIEKDCDIKNNHRVYEIKNKIISLKKREPLINMIILFNTIMKNLNFKNHENKEIYSIKKYVIPEKRLITC